MIWRGNSAGGGDLTELKCADRAAGHQTDMTTATQIGQTGLQGWREKVANGISQPVANRAPLDEDQVRAVVGAAFFVLAVIYVVKTISAATRQARQG